MQLFRWFILRPWRQHAARAALTATGIALGIAVVLGIRLANRSSLAGFSAAVDAIAGAASLEIVGVAGIDEPQLLRLGWLRDFGDPAPVIEEDVIAHTPDGLSEGLRLLGVDMLRDHGIRDYRRAAAEDRPTSPLELLSLVSEPDAVVLTSAFAKRHGVSIGDRIALTTGDTRRPFRVRGLLAEEGIGRVVDGNIAIVDIATAQWAFGRGTLIDRLDIRLPSGADVARSEREITARLPPGLSVQRPSQRSEQVETMLRAFHFNLSALSYVALVVGLFLIYNAVALSVVARRDEIGMLRALGTARSYVLALFLGEAAVLALIGTVAGSAAGWLLARGAVRLTSAGANALYVSGITEVPLPRGVDIALAVSLGIVLSLVAAAAPALEASRVPPIAAIRSADRLEHRRSAGRRSFLAAVALFIVGAGAAQLGPVGGLPLFGLLSAIVLVFGTACLAPTALRMGVRVATKPLRLFGVEGLLAHANIAGGIPRLAVSVAAVAVSLSMLVALAIMIGSFRETLIYWVGQTLRADLYVSMPRRSTLGVPATFSPELEKLIAAHPAVEAVEGFRSTSFLYRGRAVMLAAGDFRAMSRRGQLMFKEPRDARSLLRPLEGDSVLVSEPFALREGLSSGDALWLETPRGRSRFRVAAVYYDYSTDRGVILMDRPTFGRFFGDHRPTNLAVYLHAGIDASEVQPELVRQLGDRHPVFIRTNAALRQQALRIFDNTFSVTYALEAIAMLVGMLGIAGTLATLIVDRRGDLTMLSLLGAARRQIRRMVLIEAGFIGVVSQVLAFGGGLCLALLLVYVINVQSFGWTIQFDVPFNFLAQSAGVLLLAALLAGLYPARVAARAHGSIREDE